MFSKKSTRPMSKNRISQQNKKLMIVGSFNSVELGVIGGIARSCQELIRSDVSKHFQIIKVDSTQKSNPAPIFLYRLVFAFQRFSYFLYCLVRYRPDGVLIFCSDGWSFLEKSIMSLVSRMLGSKSIIFPRAGSLLCFAQRNIWTRLYLKILLLCPNYFLAQGRSWTEFAKECGSFSSSHIIEVPNWTALDKHLKVGRQIITKRSRTNEVIKVLFLGWLEKEKGVFELIDVAKELNEDGYNFELILAGDGSVRNQLNHMVEENQLTSKVKFTGWVTGQEKELVFEQADIFVLPSWSEGFPNALVEAMSFANCPVVTDVGVIQDHLVDRIHARIIPPKNVASLKASLIEVFENVEFRLLLATNAHNIANEKFNKDKSIMLLIKSLNRILN